MSLNECQSSIYSRQLCETNIFSDYNVLLLQNGLEIKTSYTKTSDHIGHSEMTWQ